MTKKEERRVSATKRLVVQLCLTVAMLYAPISSAQSLTPRPLHTDPNLAALIAVRGQFTSLIVDEQRALTLPVWAADFSPNEQVDFDQLLSRSFSELELPAAPGWGLFTPSGNTLEIQVRVTDQQGRLGRVEFRNAETWQLVGSIWANSIRTEASGIFSIPWDLREMVAEVLNDTGRVLARIAVDVGKFDAVVPYLVYGTFEPYCYAPVYCAHFSARPDDVDGEIGSPLTPPGSLSHVTNLGRSHTTVYHDFLNDSPSPVYAAVPVPFQNLWRKRPIANTVKLDKVKVGDPQKYAEVVQAVQSAVAADDSRPISAVLVAPYSEGCARWRVGFTGKITSVLAIPYERKKRQRTLEAFLGAISTLLAPQRGFLSVLAANAANQWLQDLQNQQASGLKPGEVVAWGDVYSVITDSLVDVPRVVNLTQEWTVYVRVRYPDGSTAPAEGIVHALQDTPRTSPPPPFSAAPDTYVGKQGAKIHLGKGWRWKLKVSSPGGEERYVDVPNPDPVVILHIDVATPPSQPPGGS